jgi:hypothetical protein
MSLVDDEEGDLQARQPDEDVVFRQLLGGEEHEARGSLLEGAPRVLHGAVSHCGVDRHGSRSIWMLVELRELVVLQRDQRRYDDRHSRQHRARQLVDGRLAGAGRKDRENVPALEQRDDGLRLSIPEPLPSEDATCDLGDGGFRHEQLLPGPARSHRRHHPSSPAAPGRPPGVDIRDEETAIETRRGARPPSGFEETTVVTRTRGRPRRDGPSFSYRWWDSNPHALSDRAF